MLTQEHARLLVAGADCFGLTLSATEVDRFALYIEELQRWSRIADLVARTDPAIVIRKHLLDSLAIVPLISSPGRLLDLGSGAGFPGLVLAIMRPAQEVALLEARRKRASFLRAAARRVQADNVSIYEGRVETFAEEVALQSAFTAVITRATWSIGKFLAFAEPFVAAEGVALAMRGPQGIGETIKDFAETESFRLQNVHEYVLPFGEEKRQAFVYEKFAKERFT